MATQRITPEPDTPSPVSTNICSPFSAELGAQVTFTGVVGSQTISKIDGETWPFTITSPISFPLKAAEYIYILSTGLTVGQTYNYTVSQSCSNGVQKGVTIITESPLKRPK
jgi:hypothetical protein